jgi:FtsP/CotA-like multicopper oxidase with cupredoxin domain
MKQLVLLGWMIVTQSIAFAQHEGHNTPAKQQPPKTEIYTCPMHPEVQSDKPGKCPKCGMNLEKKKVKTPVAKPAPQKKPAAPVKKEATPATHDHNMMDMNKGDEKDEKKTDMKDMDMSAQQHEAEEEMSFAGKVNMAPGKTVRYDLYVTDTMVNYTGKRKHAFAINGTLPGPDLVFTEGDTAAIYVHNLAEHETSIHWHGVILPNEFDGVPYLTTQPIRTGETHLYKFAVHQNGTYWYHSHSGLQEQAGVYGALIFKKRAGMDAMEMHEGHNMKGMDEMKMDDMKMDDHAMHNQMMKKDSVAPDLHAGHNMADMKMDGMDMKGMDHGNMQMSPMPKKGDGSYNKEQTIVLSEWTDEKPMQVQRRLRTVNDWYAIKKGSTQSYSEAIAAGHFGTKVTNEFKRMNAMDVSDVYYDRFLINGKPETEAPQYKAGDRVRLRIVNAGASSYFWVGYGGGKMTVIGNDGNEVVPIEVDRLIVGVSETYDVVVTIPNNMSYEFRATPEDRTKAASLWLGSGMKMPAPKLPRLKYFEGMKMMNDMMKMNGDMKVMDMEMTLQKMDMNRVMYDEINNPPMQHQHDDPVRMDSSEAANMMDMQGITADASGSITTLNYAMLQSPTKTMLPDAPYKTMEFELTGNMNRYVWSINNKVVREWDKIMIEKGQNVRIILFNNSMMRHPMHLHGHDFRVLNGQGEYAPLKNVLDIMPMERDTIEFAGSQSGDWFFHCHILYHMMAGMGNVFSYKNSPPNPELPDAVASYNRFLRDQSMTHIMAEIGLESNGSDGKIMIPGERYELRTEWRLGIHPKHGYESETYLGRYVGKMQWLFPFIGFDYHKNNRDNSLEKNSFGQLTNQNNRKAFVAGIEYTLPMLVTAQARIDSKGKFRFQLGREDIPLTPRLRFSAMWNTDKEYMAGFKYIIRKWLDLSTHYDSDMGFGAGITIVY